MESPFKILLADDHVMFRRGVRRIIQGIDRCGSGGGSQ